MFVIETALLNWLNQSPPSLNGPCASTLKQVNNRKVMLNIDLRRKKKLLVSAQWLDAERFANENTDQ